MIELENFIQQEEMEQALKDHSKSDDTVNFEHASFELAQAQKTTKAPDDCEEFFRKKE